MRFNPNTLEGKDTEDIVRRLISFVIKTDEQIREEGREERKRLPFLKVFIAENNGFELGALNNRIEEIQYSKKITKHAVRFFDDHTFAEELLNQDVSYVEIRTPDYDRTDQFIFINSDGYLRVLTTERRRWTKKTVEKLIQYLPNLDRLFLSSNDLEQIVDELVKTDLSGFTAKYQPYYQEREVTIQVHGADERYLEKVEDEFNALPTRLEFSQQNSPAEAIKGAVNNDGYQTYERVREGSEEVGLQTIMDISAEFEQHDKRNFEVKYTPRSETFEYGQIVEGFTTVELIEQIEDNEEMEERPSEEKLIQRLEEEILEGKRRYSYTTWQPGNYIVFDRNRGEPFEITVEGRDLALDAKEATTSTTLRDFCNLIFNEFNTTYNIEKTSARVGV